MLASVWGLCMSYYWGLMAAMESVRRGLSVWAMLQSRERGVWLTNIGGGSGSLRELKLLRKQYFYSDGLNIGSSEL